MALNAGFLQNEQKTWNKRDAVLQTDTCEQLGSVKEIRDKDSYLESEKYMSKLVFQNFPLTGHIEDDSDSN